MGVELFIYLLHKSLKNKAISWHEAMKQEIKFNN